MKNITAILLLFFGLSSHAQILIGAKAGISIPDITGNSEQSKGYTSRKDIYGGLLLNVPLNSALSLQPEINYSPQGGQRKGLQEVPADAFSNMGVPPGTRLFADFKNTTYLNYLEVPVLFKLIMGSKLKYYVCLGPYIGFLLKAETKTTGASPLYTDAAGTMPLMQNGNTLPPVSLDGTTDIKESIKKVNAGIQGGFGLQYALGRGSIFLDGRGIAGLINIQTHPEVDGKNKTGSLAVAAGYLIKIK